MYTLEEILNHLHVIKGDITKENTDAIVNAANTTLLGGGGVDGAIHRAAGPGLLDECRKLGGCEQGEARLTKGYNLPAKYVIHTPGPIYRGGQYKEENILRNSYTNSLSLAKKYGFKSITFPSISTGVYGYPKDEACSIAITATINFINNNDYLIDVTFIQFDDEGFYLYNDYFELLKKKS